MKFHYEFDIKKLNPPIGHQHKLFLIGSCFTENIGERLRRNKFNTLENPNGILFNPISVSESITSYIENKVYKEDDLFLLNEGWHSWKHHSRFSSPVRQEAINKINDSQRQAYTFLKDGDYLFITLGSSWVYICNEKASNSTKCMVAANNHKAPADWFTRKLLSTEEVLACLDNMIHRLFQFNPKIHIIFTISPVRHLREGVIENTRSKAVLIQAVHQLVDKFDQLYYFPAYELVIDDLRDYRFYAEDLVHPNYFATNYVYEKLLNACISERSRKIIEELDSIHLAYNHKPFNPASVQHQKFMHSYLEKAQNLQLLFPEVDLTQEITYFNLTKEQ